MYLAESCISPDAKSFTMGGGVVELSHKYLRYRMIKNSEYATMDDITEDGSVVHYAESFQPLEKEHQMRALNDPSFRIQVVTNFPRQSYATDTILGDYVHTGKWKTKGGIRVFELKKIT